jgi:uncharacterized protein YggL (DUF469 family)
MSAPCPAYGVMVRIALHASATSAQSTALVDDLADTVEASGLMMGGGGDRRLEFAINREGDQATNADRERIVAWAARWSTVAAIDVSDLVDLNEHA